MASIHRHAKSPFWYCAYTLPDGRRAFRSTGQRDRKKAADVCRTLERVSEKARAGELSRSTARKLFDDLLENIGAEPLSRETANSFLISWLSGKEIGVKPGVAKIYRKTLTKFLAHLGDKALKALSDITPGDIAAFRDFRLKNEGVSTSTFSLDLKVLRCAFNLAKRQGLIVRSPAETVDLPPVRHIEREVFTKEEIRALLSVATPEWRLLILSGYYLGTRLSDAAALRWDHVDLDKGLIRYTQGKTGATVIVPIHGELEKELLPLAGNDNPHGYLCPSLSKISVQGGNGLSNQFSALMKRAGIDRKAVQVAKRRFSKKSYHGLRHSFASALANAGVGADVRMKLTGHRSIDVHRSYTHVELAPLKAAIASLPTL
jgi:integrase/recombinase XerD